MGRRAFISFLSGVAVALLCLSTQAQEAGNVKRIGFLRLGPPPSAWIEGLLQGLSKLGYIEGRTIIIEFGLAATPVQVHEMAAELVHRNVDVIVASGTPSVMAARDSAGSIPVVFLAGIDPVAMGLVASLARPGGSVTGLTTIQADVIGKQLQLLREMLPNLLRIAIMVRATNDASVRYVEEAETAARTLGLQLQILTLRDSTDLEAAFIAAQGAGAVVVADDALFTAHRTQIAALALKNRLPIIYSTSEFVSAGGLISYGPAMSELYERAAVYVDRILKGAKPADLPVERPTKYELVINIKTAKALDITIPPTLLAGADAVIE